jgi:hypothetical protein
MCQADMCFSSTVVKHLKKLKKTLSLVRMPDAKMERPGHMVPVTSNRSPLDWDIVNKDILIGDPNSEMVAARKLLIEFERVMSSITTDDVLCHHEKAYKMKASVGSTATPA